MWIRGWTQLTIRNVYSMISSATINKYINLKNGSFFQ